MLALVLRPRSVPMEMSGNRWRERRGRGRGGDVDQLQNRMDCFRPFLPSFLPLTLSLLFLLTLSLSLSHSRPLSLLPSFPIAVTLGGELAEGQGRARAR